MKVSLRTSLFIVAVLSAALAGCASSGAVSDTPSQPVPKVTITQTSAVEPLRASPTTRVPVEYRLDVENPADHPVTLKAVELETVGTAGGYQMRQVRHSFNETIPAHGNTQLAFRIFVLPLQESEVGKVVSAVVVRGTARFDSNGGTVRSTFGGRLEQ